MNNILSLVGLYMGKEVLASYADGHTAEGLLLGLSPDMSGLLINGEVQPLEGLTDLEFLADLADYHSFRRCGELKLPSGNITFADNALLNPADLEKLRYLENSCRLAGHLQLEMSGGSAVFRPSELRLVHCVRSVAAPELTQRSYLYLLQDGSAVIGQLNGVENGTLTLLRMGGVSVQIEQSAVVDILRAPTMGDHVRAELRDGTTAEGIVSMADPALVLVLPAESGGSTTFLQYSQICTLQWKGPVTLDLSSTKKKVMIVTGTDSNAEQWLCKPAYCTEETEYNQLIDGSEVWFVPSVSSKYRIARQVQLPDGAEPAPLHTGYGVVIYYPMDNSRLGWIGTTFVTPEYRLRTNCALSRGNVSFRLDQLDTLLQLDTIYIVEYTCSSDPALGRQPAVSVRIVETAKRENCCCVTVNEDGSWKMLTDTDLDNGVTDDPIQIIRSCAARHHIGTLTLNDGTILSVRLMSCTDTHVTVRLLDAPNQAVQTIELSTVKSFLSQAARTDRQTASPIVNLATCLRLLAPGRPVGVLSLNDGTTAPVRLLACTDTHATMRPLGCEDQTPQMVPLNTVADFRARGRISTYRPEGFGYIGSIWFHANDMVPGSEAPQEGLTVTYTQRVVSKDGDRKVNAVEILPEPFEEKQGWLANCDLTFGRCLLRELGEEKDEAPAKELWLLPPDPAMEQLLRQCQFDGQAYRACWRLIQLAERSFVELMSVSLEATIPQRQFGYLSIWFAEKHHGFIFRPEQVDKDFRGIRNERGIFLHESEIRQNQTGKPLPTPWKYSSFAVSYDITISGGKQYATNVTILYDAQAKARAETNNSASVTPSLVMPVEKQLDLAAFAAEGEEIGILGLCSNHSAKIFRVFESGYTPESPDDVVLFDPQSIHFSPDERPDTVRTLYLVRYHKQGTTENTFTGQLHPTLAEGSTVTVLKTYRRATVQRLEISADGTTLLEKYLTGTPAAGTEEQTSALSRQPSLVPPPLEGENILLAGDDGIPQQFCTGVTKDSGLYLVTPAGENLGAAVELSDRIWRFGCITDFDQDLGVGLMNDTWTFSLDSAQLLLPMLKSQKTSSVNTVGLYCVFRCEAGHICEVQRLRKYWGLVPWVSGVLTQATKEPPRIHVTVDSKDLLHRTTTETYPDVKRRIKNNSHVGLPLWVRQVQMAWRRDQSLQLQPEAVDLHSTEQLPVIRYMESTDSYEGYENQTEHFAVQGSRAALQAVENLPAAVVFVVAPDGTTLECRLKDEQSVAPMQEPEPDEASENISELPNTPLMQLYLQSADLTQTTLRGVEMDETGMPTTPAEAIRVFKQLFTPHINYPTNWQNQLLAARIAMAFPEDIYQAPRVPAILQGVLRMKMRALSRSADAVYGELSYGLSLLMQHDRNRKDDTDYRVWLLLQDLGTAEEIMNYETNVTHGRAVTAQTLCARPLPEENAGSLLAHLLMIDPVGLEQLCPMLEQNEPLTKALYEYAATISDETRHAATLSEMLRMLRSILHRDRQNFAVSLGELCRRQSDICDDMARQLGIMSHRWLKLACRDDRERFARLQTACESAANYMKLGGFIRQEQELTNAWRTLDDLESECLAHPCRETTELLLCGAHLDAGMNVLTRLKAEVSRRLNQLYGRDSLPDLVCELNEESLPLTRFRGGEADVQLIVRNGDSRDMLQTAENPVIQLECLTPGIQVTPQIRLDHKLAAGEFAEITINLTVDDEESLAATDRVLIEWTSEFLYTASFRDGHSKQSTGNTGTGSEPLVLQLVSEQREFKDPTAPNPYRDAAKGNPLVENSKVYCHRAEEYTILRSILTTDEQGAEAFRHGATVILHGQKKSGKTSLINQIKAYIDRSEVLRDRALIIDFDSMLSNVGGVSELSNFLLMFCSAILDQFGTQIRKHRDLRLLMRENDLRIPDVLDNPTTAYARFSRFFTQFNELDQGRHTVLLFMDEFTTLCTSLLTEIENAKATGDTVRENYLQHIPDFIKDFSGKGFIQVVIGHEAMMRSLNTLGMLNQTAEFATTVELTALRPNEAEQLIREPMVNVFGYDPYRTALGADAVEYLKDITGCHPTFLVRACTEVFDFYLDEKRFPASKTQLTRRDVVSAMNKAVSELTLANFDILMVEDGDGVESPEERKTYRYLKCAAQKALASYDRRTADSREVAIQMQRELGTAEAERVRNILEARRVIRFTEGGRLRIETGLFLEYIRQRNGGKQ